MMALHWQGVLLSLTAAILVNADVYLDCGEDLVTLTWRDAGAMVDTALLLLGTCPPTSFLVGEAVFNVGFGDCNFRRTVTGDRIIYSNDLIYRSAPNDFNNPVSCTYDRPEEWLPPRYHPVVFHTFGHADLVFHMRLMNDDFSGPALSAAFPLGSLIPISATVEQSSHQPLMLFFDECVASTAPELQSGGQTYPIIANEGCLVDSKTTRSRFEPRRNASEIRLSLQAFKFVIGEEVYIHCQLVAWDPRSLDSSKKACHYVKDYGWDLLDDPSYSSLCGCCDSSCRSRVRRAAVSGTRGLARKAVLGPLTVTSLDA